MIHETAIVSKNAEIGENVTIGPYTIIHDNVSIKDGTSIEANCEIGYPTKFAEDSPLIIGDNSLIRSNSIFYQGSVFGDQLITGHQVTVREKVQAGINLQIGTLCDFQGDCIIGDYVRTHSNVHIGKKTQIGNFVWIFPYVVFTNDPHPPSYKLYGVTVEDYAVISTMSVILPGVRIGDHSLVAAHSLVNRDVPQNEVHGGSPAKFLCNTSEIKFKDGSGNNVYPWPQHFQRGYPDSIVRAWIEEFGEKST